MHFTVASGEPVVSEDLAADERFEISALLSGQNAVSGATVVIAGRDEPFGSLGAFSRQRRSFSHHDLNFMQAVANVLATAVERAQGQEMLHEVRETERRRIARDLHDDALQALTHALAMAEGPLVPVLKRVGQQLRGAIYDLRLEEQEDRPFAYLLEAFVALHAAMAIDSDVELDVQEGTDTGPLGRRGTELLRVVGEALTNARRHSGAESIRVSAWVSEERLCLEVSDDGQGFDPDETAVSRGGTGITGMRERARLLDARLEIASQSGSGLGCALSCH
jgi:signal transduction histidine kinase